jgi:ABC-type glutathione transport system ATPase component
MDKLLLVKSLNVVLKDKNRESFIVKDMSFEMLSGELLCITGSSGSGKSLTALSIAGLSTYTGNFEISGKVIFDNKPVFNFNFEAWQQIRGKDIAFIFQNPQTALNPVRSCFSQLVESITAHHPDWDKISVDARIQELLEDVDLTNVKNIRSAFPHELSGGQLQRMVIAMALANHPKLIIADEPTSSLDKVTADKIIHRLVSLCRKQNTGLILISHDLHLIEAINDRIILIIEGEKKADVSIDQYKAGKFNDALKTYIKVLQDKTNRKPIVENEDKVLEIKSVSKSYKTDYNFWLDSNKKTKILDNVSFYVRRGEMVGIYGPSGSGKTTLARIITGLAEPDTGKMTLNNQTYDMELLHQDKSLRRKIQMVMQNAVSSLQPKMKIKNQWKEILDRYESKKDEIVSFDECLNLTGLPIDTLDKYPNQLSGGQQQRAALVRSLLTDPDLIIFDESLSALDKYHQNKIIDILIQIQDKKQFAGIMISHDMDVLQRISHRIIEIDAGKTIRKILL